MAPVRWVALALTGAIWAVAVVAAAAPAAAAVAISVPASEHLGSAPTGAGTLSAQLGAVTVTASGVVAPSFVASVSSTVFTTGAKTANETIANGRIVYWSGPATASTGIVNNGSPGQPTAAQAQDLTVSRTAFAATGLLLSISASWNPTLIVNIPASAVAGSYSGTITHSVA